MRFKEDITLVNKTKKNIKYAGKSFACFCDSFMPCKPRSIFNQVQPFIFLLFELKHLLVSCAGNDGSD